VLRSLSLRSVFAGLVAVAWAAPAAAAAGVSDDPLQRWDDRVREGWRPVPGQLVVHADDVGPGLEATGCALHHSFPRRPIHVVLCPGDTRAALARWQGLPGVEVAEGVFEGRLLAVPDDLWWPLWQLENTGQTIGSSVGVAGADIGAVGAWDLSTGASSVVVAVLDTGVRASHEDLQGQLWVNTGELDCDDGLDDDGNGYVDDCAGWDFGDGDPDPDPGSSEWGCTWYPHGTFISGVIGAATDNGLGVAGVAWDLRLLPLKIQADADCAVSEVSLAEAVYYAMDAGSTAINASWTVGYSLTLRRAMTDANDAGVITVIAAGNDSLDLEGGTYTWPIQFGLSRAIAVAASTNQDTLASFSNYGATKVDLAAPGQDIYSTTCTGDSAYAWASGTSFAAPVVAGAVALVSAGWPMLRADEVVDAVAEGVDAIPALDCAASARCVRTGGRLSLPEAFARAQAWAETEGVGLGETTLEDSDGDGLPEGHETLSLWLVATGTGHADVTGVTATLHVEDPRALVTSGAVVVGTVPGDGELAVAEPLTLRLDGSCTEDFDLALGVTFADDAGQSWEGAVPVAVTCRLDQDADGVREDEDCDDARAEVGPGFEETCDGLDNDCDGGVDEEAVDAIAAYDDADGDGYGAPSTGEPACELPEGAVTNDLDCDDDDAGVNPDAAERCDGVDQDCDGAIDDAEACAPADTDPPSAENGGGGGGKGGCATGGGPPEAWLGLLSCLSLLRRRRISSRVCPPASEPQ
jgi:subtilisin family serine protease